MAKVDSRFLGFLPKRWRRKVAYVVYFALLLFIEIIEQLEKATDRLAKLVKKHKVLLVAGSFVFIVLGAVAVSVILDGPDAEADVVTYSVDTPSESRPDETYTWRGRPEDPMEIRIPSAQTEGFIQKVGKDQNGQIAVPNNIHIAGWFIDSARPGQQGLSIIDGHVDGRSEQGGVFKHIGRLNTDDTFQVELGSGTVLDYKVHTVTSVETDKAASQLFSQMPGVVSQLNLITCGGNYDRELRDYDQRIIVVAELL